MINLNELRIGNLVKGPRGIETIREILDEFVECEISDKWGGFVRSYEEIHPIPITPEILEKIEEYDKGSILDDRIAFYENTAGITLCWGEYCNQGSLIPVKYLHELQNLYWLLTHKELTINLILF